MSLLMYLTISQISNIAAHFSVSFRMSQEQRETENKSFLKRAEICKVGDVSPTFLEVKGIDKALQKRAPPSAQLARSLALLPTVLTQGRIQKRSR